MSITHTPLEALEILVRDLNDTTWSSWQSTSKFSIALNIAEQVIKREKAREAASDLLDALEFVMDRLVDKHEDDVAAQKARAAIAKATGGAA